MAVRYTPPTEPGSDPAAARHAARPRLRQVRGGSGGAVPGRASGAMASPLRPCSHRNCCCCSYLVAYKTVLGKVADNARRVVAFRRILLATPLRTSTHTRIVVGVVLSRFSWHIKLWRAGCRPRASRCSMWSLFEELSPGDPFCGDRLLDAAPSTRGAGVAVACGSNPRRDSRSAALVATLIHTGNHRR